METGGQVTVRPVRTYQAGVVTTDFQIDSTWYDPNKHYANFVIWHPKKSCGSFCLTSTALRTAFGQPAHIYKFGGYQILVYHRNLLTVVPEVSWCADWP